MSPLDLLRECEESEKFAEGTSLTPGFRVQVKGANNSDRVQICKGLAGKNLGHYDNEAGQPVTHVFLETKTVRGFLREWFESKL